METHAELIIASSLKEASLAENLTTESTDVRHFLVEKFGIDESRQIRELTSRRSVSGDEYTFVIVAKTLTTEAQNALLKLFEEPPANTKFYLVIPHESILLATLRSRLFSQITTKKHSISETAEEFFNMSYKERLELITEKAKKDPSALSDLVISLGQDYGSKLDLNAKKSLLLAEKYVYNRGASRKILLEELALSLPVGKF